MITDHFKYTDKGPRQNNQDSVESIAFPNLFFACVADGVGGCPFGEVASKHSITSFVELISGGTEDLGQIIEVANKKLLEAHILFPQYVGMCTTFTGCTIKDNVLHFAHAGDSRLCVIRQQEVMQLSDNHTEVEYLLRTGQLREQEAALYPRRNVILSGLGIYEDPIIQTDNFALQPGDRVLLTTDGVHEIINTTELSGISAIAGDAAEFGALLVALLATKRLTDNVSFVIMFVA